MNQHESINYLELPAKDISASKTFFHSVFNWRFEDYGPQYSAFFESGIEGGFYHSDLSVSAEQGSVLIVFYSKDLHETQQKILAAGGEIVKEIFDFPGGKRFHFRDPSQNEFAVWSES